MCINLILAGQVGLFYYVAGECREEYPVVIDIPVTPLVLLALVEFEYHFSPVSISNAQKKFFESVFSLFQIFLESAHMDLVLSEMKANMGMLRYQGLEFLSTKKSNINLMKLKKVNM
jgi:hypothetical protein